MVAAHLQCKVLGVFFSDGQQKVNNFKNMLLSIAEV